jgi:prepilin peptidase CpaA
LDDYAAIYVGENVLTSGLTFAAIGLLVYAALHDLAVRTVPNWVPAMLALLGICLRLADHSLLDAAIISAASFGVLFVIWLLGGMGGGDVKLWAATVLLIPPLLQPELAFVLRVVVLGGLLAVCYLVLCFLIPKPKASRDGGHLRRVLRTEAWRIGRRAPLPYACAIAGGAIATFFPSLFSALGRS